MKKITFVLLSIVIIFFCFQTNAPADKESPKVSLLLNQIVGASPKVFTDGWIFGAKGILNKGTEEETDISENVRWSGSGTFTPSTGPTTRPFFNSEGYNDITMTYDYKGITYSETFRVYAISSDDYANLLCFAYTSSDAHGCPACPHPCVGVCSTYSSTVMVRGYPAIRKGDSGMHAACCGPNTFEIIDGDSSVLVDGKPSARIGSQTKHCGSMGIILNEENSQIKAGNR